MMNLLFDTSLLKKAVCVVVAALLLHAPLWAQKTAEREKNDSIAAKYKHEHAVYLNYKEKLVIAEGSVKHVALCSLRFNLPLI